MLTIFHILHYLHQPSEILDLLLPLSAYVDKLLNDAILACDPDKEEKDKAKADKKLKKVEKQV
jgi:hypothetical protein